MNIRKAFRRVPVFGVGLGLFALWGCGSGSSSGNSSLPPAVSEAVSRNAPVDGTLVSANDSFGFDLLGQLNQGNTTQNVFISPASVALALEIAYNGAGGSTQQAMAQTLHLQSMDLPTLNNANAALQASLVNPDPKVTLSIANSLWYNQNAGQINSTFVQSNQTYYGSQLGSLAGAPGNVNAWVSSKTNGNITSILPPGDYSSTVAILVNAIYFKGQWTQKFDSAQTASAPFTRLDGSTTNGPIMHQTGYYDYYQGNGFQLVRLPYGQGRMSMIVALPDSGTDWNTFVSSLTAQNLNAWIGQLQKNTYGNIGLPRFTTNYSSSLKDTLSTLGMGVAFDPMNADFQPLMADPSGPPFYLTFVYHKTYLAVDEQGTTASGVTGVGIGTTSAPVPFQMTMNHPFFCAIRDDKTGELLFLGVIVDPNAS